MEVAVPGKCFKVIVGLRWPKGRLTHDSPHNGLERKGPRAVPVPWNTRLWRQVSKQGVPVIRDLCKEKTAFEMGNTKLLRFFEDYIWKKTSTWKYI